MTLASKDTEFIIYSDIAFVFKHFPTFLD